MRRIESAVLIPALGTLAFIMVPARSPAQPVSVAAGLDAITYHGTGLNERDGLRSVHATVQYAVTAKFLVGLGGSVGNFDSPDQDASFTAYTVFIEPALIFGTGRYRGYVGPRLGWEQERLGSQPSHVGGSFGAATGLLVALSDRWSVGVRTQLDYLRLGNWEANDEPSLRGVRWQIGPEIRWTNQRSAR